MQQSLPHATLKKHGTKWRVVVVDSEGNGQIFRKNLSKKTAEMLVDKINAARG